MKMFPLSDNKELIKSSPLLIGESSKFNKKPNINTPFSHVGAVDSVDPFFEENQQLYHWLLQHDYKEPTKSNSTESTKDNYSPIVLF